MTRHEVFSKVTDIIDKKLTAMAQRDEYIWPEARHIFDEGQSDTPVPVLGIIPTIKSFE